MILDAGVARPRLSVTAVERRLRWRGRCRVRRARGLILRASRRCGCICLRWGRASTSFCCCCITSPATAGRWRRCCAISVAFYEARCRACGGDCGAAGAICRLHAVAARGSGLGGGWGERDCAPAVVLDQPAGGASGPARSSARPCAACGVEPSRGERWAAAVWAAARCLAGACARERGEPVHGAAGWAERAADAAWCGQRHCDREPDCGSHRQRAGRSCRVLREHAGAAHGHVWAIRASGSWLGGCVRAILRPTATRSFRSSVWWRCSTLRARCRVIRCSR